MHHNFTLLTKSLYMFRAPTCPSSGRQTIYTPQLVQCHHNHQHTRYIKNNDPRSAYALHILNCRHKYGNMENTMTLLKPINTPNLLLPYEQMHIQALYLNNELIPEQQPNEPNHMFQIAYANNTRHNYHDEQ